MAPTSSQRDVSSKNDTDIDEESEWLDLSKALIEAKHTKAKARALENNRYKKLKTLFLHDNAGDLGIRAMLNALQAGHLKPLEKLILWNASSYDQITNSEEGTDSIADALAMGKMPKLHTLDLSGFLPKLIDVAPRPWSKVFRDLGKLKLGDGRMRAFFTISCFREVLLAYCCGPETGERTQCLNCQWYRSKIRVFSGDDGLRKILGAIADSQTPLEFLNLRDNYISDKGAIFLAHLLREGALPKLQEVDLQNNPVGLEGARAIVRAYYENPLLTVSVMLDWSNPFLKERASALREKNIRLEHKLKELDPEGEKWSHGEKSKKFFWRPECSLKPPVPKSKHSEDIEHSYRFLMHCQCGDHDRFQGDAAGSSSTAISSAFPGTELRRKSLLRTAPRRIVNRVVEDQPPSTADGASDVAALDLYNTGIRDRSARVNVRLVEDQPPSISTAYLDEAGDVPPLDRYYSGIRDRSGRVNVRVTITADSWGFIGAATRILDRKAGKSQKPPTTPPEQESQETLDREPGRILRRSEREISPGPSRHELENEGFWKKCLSAITRVVGDEDRTERQITSIIVELLMLADRKPTEFHKMFGLTRVLLEDEKKKYYPAYICDTCIEHYKEDNKPCISIVNEAFLARNSS